jgi:hypothetical protein
MNRKRIAFISLLCIFTSSIYAKRLPPPEVEPLSKGNFIYKAAYSSSKNNSYDFGLIVIESIGDVKYRFSIPIYSVIINKLKEYDVQWKFIKSMKFKNDEIITIINERNQIFELNINTYEVKCISGENDSDVKELFEKSTKEIIGKNKKYNYKGPQPEKKKLLNIEDVISVAENALFPIYGEEHIKREMPYKILKYKDKWYICGSLPEKTKGGVFEIVINGENSQIESVIHGK